MELINSSKSSNKKSSSIPSTAEVIIVGGGVSGASSAYHLAKAGVKNIIVLDCGTFGHGRTDSLNIPETSDSELKPEYDIDRQEPNHPHWRRSGSSVMKEASTVKMMIHLYFSVTADFVRHHGKEGVRKYFKITNQGIRTQKEIAKKVLPEPETQIRTLGTLYLALKEEEADIKKEFNLLKEAGLENIEWWTQDKVQREPGVPKHYYCGIHFPEDAVIDSSNYASAVLKYLEQVGAVLCFPECSPVVSVNTEESKGVVVLEDGSRLEAKNVVLCTGGLFTADPVLSGVMRPCYSYLAAIPHPKLEKEKGEISKTSGNGGVLSGGIPLHSKNFLTWTMDKDWCWTDGGVRISGEDHYSALKAPRVDERAGNLAKWVQSQYPEVFKPDEPLKFTTQYGVYSETPDYAPIIGHTNSKSRVCYLIGCNGWGQAVLSYLATLIPGLLGYVKLTSEQEYCLSLASIQRFKLLPEVIKGKF